MCVLHGTRNHGLHTTGTRLFQVSAVGLGGARPLCTAGVRCSFVRINGPNGMADDDVHNCQACHMLTNRKCSVCSVCVFCSIDCEQSAAKVSYARIACAEHMKRTRVPENLGVSAVHYMMLPRTPIDSHSLKEGRIGADQLSQRMWEILFHGAKHYMHLLIAASPSSLFEKTAFGMSVVLMGTCDHLSAGFQRLSYPLGQPDQAAELVLANAAKLARAQLRNAFHQRALFVVGTTHLEPSPIVHFDAIYVLVTPDGTWSIKGIKPLWAQTLTYTNNRHYKMHYRPNGHVPIVPLHALSLAEKAFKQAQADPPLAQSLLEATPPLHPPLPPPLPAMDLEALRAQALAAANASEEAPPWAQQLLEALPQA